MRCPSGLKSFLLLLLPALLSLHCAAKVAFHNFNSNDGLPSNEVYCVLQDHEGFLWFGTDHGVVKYNGYNFKTFTTADGLTDNTVLAIKKDDDNNIWFLTLSGGLCYFDGKHIAPHPNNDTIRSLCSKRIPTSFEVLANQEVWMGFVEMGVAKIEKQQTNFYGVGGPMLRDDDTVHLYVLHLAEERSIYLSSTLHNLPGIVDSHVRSIENYNVSFKFLPQNQLNFSILSFKNHSMLMAQGPSVLGMDSVGNIYKYRFPPNNQVLSLVQTKDSKVWMLVKNSPSYVVRFRNGQFSFVDSLSKNATHVLLDNQGNYWFTTLDQGILMAPDTKIHIYNSGISASDKLSCINSNGKHLFVGLPESKMLKIDTSFQASWYSTGRKTPAAISAITFRLNGEPQTNMDTAYDWYKEIDVYRTKILELDKDRVLLGMTGGLALLGNKKVLYKSRLSGFNKRVTEICRLNDQKILIGTYSGLYYYEPDKNNRLTEDPFFKNTRITSTKNYNTQLFGVSTRGRGIILNIHHTFYGLNQSRGLVSDLAEDLYFENDSTLWVASFKGISKVYFHVTGDSLFTRIKNYTKEDGLCSNQVNGITGFNGFIWLATNEGLCYFKPADLTEETMHLPLYFGNISVNGAKRPIDSLSLNADENSILIEFNALYYKAIGGIRYKFRLKGTSPWKYTTLNYVQYFTLPPGHYQFEVAAQDKGGKYQSDISTLNFTIRPRFVETTFFRILIGLLILLIIAAIASSIVGYQKLKATNLIKLLQAEFKALSYQINPHFIFNVLNSIQYYILKKDTDNAIHLLGSFSTLIRRIVNNSRQQYIGIIEEVECLKEYMDLEKMRLDNKFEYYINIDSSIDVEDKNILPMIIQPLVENSIWHGIVPSNKPGLITVDFKKVNGGVVCKVEDNGVGINSKPVKKEQSKNNLSMAMENVTERLKIIGELNNSAWEIKTTDKSVEHPDQTGTIVTIVFPAIKRNP